MKRVFIVHGWGGHPDEGWFPWLRKALEAEGFEVHIPQLPEANNPRIYNWVPALSSVVGISDEETYFVGHSMGCQTIVRYLETLPEGQKIGGAVFVAGFFRPLTGLEESDNETDRHWAQTPINFEKVKFILSKSFALFSDDDSYVPISNAEDFKNKLGSEIVIQHNQGHFNEDSGFKELPIVLEKLLKWR